MKQKPADATASFASNAGMQSSLVDNLNDANTNSIGYNSSYIIVETNCNKLHIWAPYRIYKKHTFETDIDYNIPF